MVLGLLKTRDGVKDAVTVAFMASLGAYQQYICSNIFTFVFVVFFIVHAFYVFCMPVVCCAALVV